MGIAAASSETLKLHVADASREAAAVCWLRCSASLYSLSPFVFLSLIDFCLLAVACGNGWSFHQVTHQRMFGKTFQTHQWNAGNEQRNARHVLCGPIVLQNDGFSKMFFRHVMLCCCASAS